MVFSTADSFKEILLSNFTLLPCVIGIPDSWRKLSTIWSLGNSVVSCRCTHKLSISSALMLLAVKSNKIKNICSLKTCSLYLVY